MREIKFRVWNGREMVYDITVGRFGVFYVNPTNNGLDFNDSASITPFTTKYHKDTPLMQYTGLKDKNGKEIYEGDIVHFRADYCPVDKPSGYIDAVVEFIGVGFALVSGEHVYSIEEETDEFNHRSEVIGNIHQNPNLL
jgi:uncharacterized phage protein (TIGR01671 family)